MVEEWLTVDQAAELSGYHANYIRLLLREGKVKARKFGPVWQVHRQTLLEFVAAAEKSEDKRRGPK